MIRLSRTGARKQPQYRVVVIEKERARNGRPVEVVGTYNPRTNPASIELKRERIDYWVSKGARMSDRVSKIVAKPAPATTASVAWFPFVSRISFHWTGFRLTGEIKTAPTGNMRVLIEQIAKALVDDPSQVSVNPVDEGGETVLELTVGPNDLGRVIGKQGRTARAMRNLLGAAGLKFNKRFTLEILE
jgi:small subunit ribosomal protein S16